MKIKKIFFVLPAFLIMTSAWADGNVSNSHEPCDPIVKACINAGYMDKSKDAKEFWFDCMKPLIMGKTVKDAVVSSQEVKACREDKIQQLKTELNELETVK